MTRCARHPFILWLALLVADIDAASRIVPRAEATHDPEMGGWVQLCFMAVLFGTLCIRFPHILGNMQRPMGRGSWLNPTPEDLVRRIGWGLMVVPLIVTIFLILGGR